MKNIVGTVTFPVRWCISAIADGFEGWGTYFQSIDSLMKQNEALKEENESLSDRLDEAELLEEENERLREYLGIKNKYPSFTMEEGRVISYSSGNYMTNFTLDKGSLHGIDVNMPVITARGIVGRVSEVGLNWCMVSTIIESNVAVGAYVQRSGTGGMINGDYSMMHEGVCKLGYLDANSDIVVGDKILSKGTGSMYPADLEIGTVIDISLDEYTRNTVATVQPSVDFSSLKWVMILTGYEGE